VVVATATMLVTIVLALGWAFLMQPAADRASRGPGGAATSDVNVENVLSHLADGRDVRGSFTLRMREGAAPRSLRAVARLTPTPGQWLILAGVKTPVPRQPGSVELSLRDRVADALSSLTYADTAGEDGRARLRDTVRDSVNGVLPGAPVTQVFVRDFLVK
jgi:hypothetical protein